MQTQLSANPNVWPSLRKTSLSQANTLSLNSFIVPAASAPVNSASSVVEQAFVPTRESLGRRDPDRRRDHDQVQARQIRQRKDFLAATDAQHRSANQEQRQIAANFGRNAQLVLP